MEISKEYISKISQKGNNNVSTWANNEYGSISFTNDGCYRFIKNDIDENGKLIDNNYSDSKRKQCPIVARGVIVYWFLYRNSQNDIMRIFNGYLSNCKEKIEKENKEDFIFDMPETIILLKHLKQEFFCMEESTALFNYISEDDKEYITKLTKAYIRFVTEKINFEQIEGISKDELLTLLFLSNYPDEDKESPFFMNSNIFTKACHEIGDDYLLIADTNDGMYVQIREEGLGVIESLLENSEEVDNTDDIQTKTNSQVRIITITKGKEDIFFNTILSLYKHNVFSTTKGDVIDEKTLLEDFGKLFNLDFNEIKKTIDSKNIELTEELLPLFYNDATEVSEYIIKMEAITDNTEKAKYTAELVNAKIISNASCKKPLWSILSKYGLYDKGEENWRTAISKYL